MKTKMVILICLLVLGISFLNREYTLAQTSSPISKIGIVNVERVLMECDATKEYMEKARSEIQKLKEEQEKMNTSIQVLEQELDSGAFKFGSSEFYQKNRELAKKKSDLNLLMDFNQQELSLKNQLWQMDLYKKVMQITKEIGKEKDLYLVLSVEEPEMSPDDFTLVVRTHKVLYGGEGMDLTDIVISRLNQQK
ncbi:MAG: OmpH family outer membrane protein [Sedimentisphaerales bacterium]|nr:OmpH family outer membrane protein [Sedimentisphaerales bacterium]